VAEGRERLKTSGNEDIGRADPVALCVPDLTRRAVAGSSDADIAFAELNLSSWEVLRLFEHEAPNAVLFVAEECQ
jgi:hypothetical protein